MLGDHKENWDLWDEVGFIGMWDGGMAVCYGIILMHNEGLYLIIPHPKNPNLIPYIPVQFLYFIAAARAASAK